MVHISNESAAETDARLRRVMAEAVIVVEAGEHVFAPLASPREADLASLALVRYDSKWCELRPGRHDEDSERFVVWRVAFPDGGDNSGFVGWLATHLKRRLGTGVFVTCGSHPDANGVFDYWGAPESLREEVLTELRALNPGLAQA